MKFALGGVTHTRRFWNTPGALYRFALPVRPVAWLRIENESDAVPVGHGELIGRMPSAALRLDDGRISEAHAMVSLRGRSLRLLGLRGRFRVSGKVRADVVLRDGMSIELASDLGIVCERIELPEFVLGFEGERLPLLVPTGTTSLFGGPEIEVRPGFHDGADAVLWSFGTEWRYRAGDGEIGTLGVGSELPVGESMVAVRQVPLAQAAPSKTRRTMRPPIRVQIYAKGVAIGVDGASPVFLGGTPGMLVRTLAASDGPMPWTDVAARVWEGDRSSRDSIRRRFDATVARARGFLSELALPASLLELDHAGGARLALLPNDEVEHVEED